MDILYTAHPNLSQQEELHALLSACREKEPLSLSIPEDGDGFFLAYEKAGQAEGRPLLVSCGAFCTVSADLWECYGLTRPEYRRKGLFGRMLEEICRMAQEQEEKTKTEINLAFLSDGNSADGLAAFRALDMEYWYSEYRMEGKVPLIHSNASQEAGSLFLKKFPGQAGSEEDMVFYAYPAAGAGFREGQVIGACRLFPLGPSCFCLHHVEIGSDFRGKGWGGKLMDALSGLLPPGSRIILQVSSLNLPAMALYKKTGFRITETLSYYLY